MLKKSTGRPEGRLIDLRLFSLFAWPEVVGGGFRRSPTGGVPSAGADRRQAAGRGRKLVEDRRTHRRRPDFRARSGVRSESIDSISLSASRERGDAGVFIPIKNRGAAPRGSSAIWDNRGSAFLSSIDQGVPSRDSCQRANRFTPSRDHKLTPPPGGSATDLVRARFRAATG